MGDHFKRLLNQIYFNDVSYEDLAKPLQETLTKEIQLFDILKEQINSFTDSKLVADHLIVTAWETSCQLEFIAIQIHKLVNCYCSLQNKEISKFDSHQFHQQYFFQAAAKYDLHQCICRVLQLQNQPYSTRLLHQAYKTTIQQHKEELKCIQRKEKESLGRIPLIKLQPNKELLKERVDQINQNIEQFLFDDQVREFEYKLEQCFALDEHKLTPNIPQFWIARFKLLI